MFKPFTKNKKKIINQLNEKLKLENTSSFSPFNFLEPSDQIINNYNVKVNITKKKTKNFSIGNLTLNNPNIFHKKDLFNLQLTNPYDYFLRNSENISPKNSKDDECKKKESKEKDRNSNSVLNSPKHSYNKIISNLQHEFDEITNKGLNILNNNNNQVKNKSIKTCTYHSREKKLNRHYQSKSAYNNFANETTTLREKKNAQPLNQTLSKSFLNGKDLSLNSNKNLINARLTTNYNPKKKKINKCSFIIEKISFSFEPTKNFHLELKNEKEKNKELSSSLRESSKIKDLLLNYIKSQEKVYLNSALFYKHKAYLSYESEKITQMRQQIQELIKQNNDLKLVILKMMYFLEKDRSEIIVNEKYYLEKFSQILKENEYLRKTSLVIDYDNLQKLQETENDPSKISSLVKKTFLDKFKDKPKTNDIFSEYMKNVKIMEQTIKKGNSSQSVLHHSKNSSIIKINKISSLNQKKRKLCYIKK